MLRLELHRPIGPGVLDPLEPDLFRLRQLFVRGPGQLAHGGQLHGRGFGHDLGALLLELYVPVHLFVPRLPGCHQGRHLGLLFCLRFGQAFRSTGGAFVRTLEGFGRCLRFFFFHLPIVEHFGQEFILQPEVFRPVPDRR